MLQKLETYCYYTKKFHFYSLNLYLKTLETIMAKIEINDKE